jgi:anti-sigma factor RsiW
MTCEELVEFLSRYLDGELPESERSVFEKHLKDCPPCEVYLDSFREAIRLGRQVCSEEECGEMPENLVKAILAARGSEPKGGA